ncbi:interactor of constitutive active ROPs 4-like [Zingiber officinale]|uniref:interactor of constitutive active ROPs 4-like n=1 Tax=Zingiber officinale TaxID=94328 RepID=UPI001C4C1F26|nr:interactor of constitutive active ROPs 4-like [Zingiber officinale]XP_042417384.1 interactor of constitutive active ROPs 4-like [Zingiber officinale]
MGSRGSEGPDRPSPRVPLYLRSTACSEANSVRHRPAAAAAAASDRSVKVSSLGGSQERKRGTRVVELETKLSKSQAELKKLKERLAEAEAAKVEAEQALAKAKKRTPLAAAVAVDAKAEEETPAQAPDYRLEDVRQNVNEEETVTSPATMDVFEVVAPAEPVPPEHEVDGEQGKEENVAEKQQEEETKAMIEKLERHEDNETAAAAAVAEEEEEEKEVVILEAKLLEKEREVAVLLEENKIFKIKAEEEAKQLAESAQAKQEHLAAQLNSIEKKLKDSKTKEQQLSSQLEAAEGSKATLEMDLKRMKVQMEQWRKAAEAAAEVLATAGNDASEEMSDRILAERCSSMDKYLEADYRSWESPSIDEDTDEDGSGGGWGRRKGAGVRMFGNLWKKNQHK